MIKRPQAVFAGIILTLFVLVAMGGVFGLARMAHHGQTPTCIFMPGEEAVCPMTALEHIARWQSTFAGALVVAVLLLATLTSVIRGRGHAPPHAARYTHVDLMHAWRLRILIRSTISPRAPWLPEIVSRRLHN